MADAPQPPEHTAYNAANRDNDYAAHRAVLRREKLAARLALPDAEHGRFSAQVEAHLERELAGREPGRIGFCWPIRKEFDARPLVGRLIVRGWQACMPTVVTENAPMRFRPWLPTIPMTTDRFGIPIPADGAETPPPDVVLLPVVAFDGAGYRLGYGGGYFDRTLAVLMPRPLCYGVGFELARTDVLAPQAHDIPLDAIVTEAGVMRAGRVGDAGKLLR